MLFTQTAFAEINLSQEEASLLEKLEIKIQDEKESVNEKIEKIESAIKVGEENLEDAKTQGEGIIEEKKDEIESDIADVKDKAKDELENFKKELDSEKEKLKKEIEKEKKILVDTAKREFIPGMGLSLFSLTATAVVAPIMALFCFDQPSVKIYTAGAAYYLFKELSQWKKFKVSMMMTMERIEKVDFNDDKSIRENVSSGKSFLRSQLDFMDGQLDILKNGFEAIEKKAVNAKHVSYAYAAAGGAALLETYFGGGGVCKGLAENHVSPQPPIFEFLFPSAFANDQKKMDYVGDVDKLGIVMGGLVSAGLVFAIYKGYFPAIKGLLKLGGTRSALFLANSGIALLASKKLKEASKVYLDRINEIKSLIAKLRVKLEEGADKIDRFLDKLDKLGAALVKYGIVLPKKLTEMSVNELKSFIKTIDPKEKAFESSDINLLEEVKLYLNVKTSHLMKPKRNMRFNFPLVAIVLHSFNHAQARECGVQNGQFNILIDESCKCVERKNCVKSKVDPINSNQFKSFNNFLVTFKTMMDGDFHGNTSIKLKYQSNFEKLGPQIPLMNENFKKSVNSNLLKSGKKQIPFDQIEKAIKLRNDQVLEKEYINAQKKDLFDTDFITPTEFNSKQDILKKKNQLISHNKNKDRQRLTSREIELLKGIRARLLASTQSDQDDVSYKFDDKIEKNTSRNIFEMISKRYMIKFSNFK